MAETLKHEKIAAFRLMPGKLASSSFVYNGSTIMSLGANHAIPYTAISVKGTTENARDDSIEGLAHQDLPVLMGTGASLDTIECNMRYEGLDKLLYWMFGFEDPADSPEDLGGGYFAHLYELDRHETEAVAYRSDEDTAVDYDPTDIKNRFAVLAQKLATNDHRYPFLICSGFGFSSEAGGFLKANGKGVASREDRGDYDSDEWTFADGLAGSGLVIPHHHLTVSLGEAGALVDVGVKNITVNVDKPQFVDRDSESGLAIAQPVLSGKYEAQVSITLARHSVDTWLAYRDAFTECAMKLVWSFGSYEFGLYFPSVVLSDTAPSEDEVARLPITFAVGKQPDSNPFTTELGGLSLVQDGAIFCITKNQNDTNEMRRE